MEKPFKLTRMAYKVAYEITQDSWQWYFEQTMNETSTFCKMVGQENVSIEYYSCTRQLLFWQQEKEGQCLWENLKEVMTPIIHGDEYGAAAAAYIAIMYWDLIFLSVIQYFLLLYASWFCFCQAVAVVHAKQAAKLVGTGFMVGKFTVDKKEQTAQNLGASSCTTLLIPTYDPEISLMTFNVVLKLVNDIDHG